MSRIPKQARFSRLEGVYFVVLVGANFIAALTMTALSSLIRTESDTTYFVSVHRGLDSSWILSFIVPSVLCVLYLQPFNELRQGGQSSMRAKSRLLNAPLLMSLISMTGWLVGIAVFIFGVFVNHLSLEWRAFGRFVLEALLTGSLVFVISYYLLEFVSRRAFIPRYFPKGELSAIEGVINLSVRARFFIFFYAVSIFPAFLFFSIIAVLEGSGSAEIVPTTAAMTAVGLVLAAFVTYLISSAYQTPLVEMKHATEEIENGNYEAKVAVVSTDELGRLGEGINDMAVGLKERERLKEENERVKQELAMAWHIQESFLPKELPYVPGWQLTAKLEPAKQTSGDFYDLIPLPDGRLGLLVADVTDKGMGAALYMALSCTIIRTFAGEFYAEPQKVLDAAHRRILADTDTNQFVTVFYGILDPATGVLTYSNAGHNPPFLLGGRSGDVPATDVEQLIAVHELTNTGPPLGLRMFKDIAWEQGSVQVGAGDVLVLYSDGVTEAQDLGEEFFEEERLLSVLRANVGQSAQLIQDALIGEVHGFVGQAPQSDDITVMVIVRE
jgi:sigma-B regulation protein RsbU (phosphoserine phosphatase)